MSDAASVEVGATVVIEAALVATGTPVVDGAAVEPVSSSPQAATSKAIAVMIVMIFLMVVSSSFQQ